MTDEEARLLEPAVNEFVDAVSVRDYALTQACLHHTPPATLAILCAELVRDARHKLAVAERVLHETRGINPAGVSKQRAWEIATASAERGGG